MKKYLVLLLLLIPSLCFGVDAASIMGKSANPGGTNNVDKVNGLTWGTASGNATKVNGVNCAAAAAGLAYVTSSGAGKDGHETNVTLQYGANVSTGQLLIAAVCTYTADPPSSVSDDKSNTWTTDIRHITTGTERCAIYSAVANVGSNGTMPTVTFGLGSLLYYVVGVAAFSGQASNTPVDTSSDAQSSTDVHAGDLVTDAATINVGIMANTAGGTTTPDANWTQIWEQESSTNLPGSWCYRITTGSGTYNDGWTIGSTAWGAASAAYK